MARYQQDVRRELQFFTGSLDLLLPGDSLARVIWAGLEKLDFSHFDARYKNDASGRTALDPRCLTGVWMLGMVRGVTSSVRLAWLCGQDIEFRWLVGGTSVEKSTLCDFRKNHQAELLALSTQVLMALGQNKLLPGEHMGVDGTVVRAASSRHSSKSRKGLQKQADRLKEVLREKLAQDDGSPVSEERTALAKRQARLEQALAEMTAQGLTQPKDRLVVTEPEAKTVRQKDGSFAPGYSAQVITDMDSGAIIHSAIVEGADGGQLQPQCQAGQRALVEVGARPAEGPPPSVAADGAYHDTRQLNELEENGVKCYVPEDRTAHRLPPGVSPEFRAQAFTYDEQTDTMRCPAGEDLKRRKRNASQTATTYQASAATCQSCPHKAHCCPNSQTGRCVNRTLPQYAQTLEVVSRRVESDEGRFMKKARSVVCEGAFARLNGLLHWKRCRMWGRAGAEAELLWRQLTQNLMLLTGTWKPLVPATKPTG